MHDYPAGYAVLGRGGISCRGNGCRIDLELQGACDGGAVRRDLQISLEVEEQSHVGGNAYKTEDAG
jgi:hypothetical protein